jgi:hypothetical protein
VAKPTAQRHGLLVSGVGIRLGWIDGRNIAIEYRWAEGRERLPEIAAHSCG